MLPDGIIARNNSDFSIKEDGKPQKIKNFEEYIAVQN
jgi:hypothetical protein